jgi:hypothetical protein
MNSRTLTRPSDPVFAVLSLSRAMDVSPVAGMGLAFPAMQLFNFDMAGHLRRQRARRFFYLHLLGQPISDSTRGELMKSIMNMNQKSLLFADASMRQNEIKISLLTGTMSHQEALERLDKILERTDNGLKEIDRKYPLDGLSLDDETQDTPLTSSPSSPQPSHATAALSPAPPPTRQPKRNLSEDIDSVSDERTMTGKRKRRK